MSLALTILLTGLVMVFAVLVLLIFLIEGYGTIIYNVQNKINEKNKKKFPAEITKGEHKIPDEIVAVISAAVSSVYSKDEAQYEIKNVKRMRKQVSRWSTVGILDETSPF